MNIDDLSREIAATSDAWMQLGVEVVRGRLKIRICVILDHRFHGMDDFGARYEWTAYAGDLPNLADPVTVNSLLGAGEVIKLEHPKGWTAYIGGHSAYGNDTRTEAICRAWIAAHKEKP